MAKEKAKEKTKYKFALTMVCVKCGTIIKELEPCTKCEGIHFSRVYELQKVE